MFEKTIHGKTKKQIIKYFYTKFLQEKNDYVFVDNYFIASNTNETISMSKFGSHCVFVIQKGNYSIERTYSDGQFIVKKYFFNENLSCCTGPAMIYFVGNHSYECNYYINGIEYNRTNYRKFIKSVLKLTNFNHYKNLSTLENIKLILKAHSRVEQLEVLNKRIELLKVIKNLENS